MVGQGKLRLADIELSNITGFRPTSWEAGLAPAQLEGQTITSPPLRDAQQPADTAHSHAARSLMGELAIRSQLQLATLPHLKLTSLRLKPVPSLTRAYVDHRELHLLSTAAHAQVVNAAMEVLLLLADCLSTTLGWQISIAVFKTGHRGCQHPPSYPPGCPHF